MPIRRPLAGPPRRSPPEVSVGARSAQRTTTCTSPLDAMTGEVRWVHKGRDIAGTSGVPVIVDDRVLAARTPGWIRGVRAW